MWKGARTGGYGSFWYRTRPVRAHRVAWELTNGVEIPEKLLIMHSCDTPLCVNPKHLILGTKQANNYDRDRKERQRTCRGEAHKLAKLTEVDVAAIRARLASGATRASLAKEHSVAKSLIARIAKREAWPHV